MNKSATNCNKTLGKWCKNKHGGSKIIDTLETYQQPLRRFNEPKKKAIASKLHRLENAAFIREIKISTWVSNPVIIPKKNTDVQRVCVDYTSLKKHCPKDPILLPRIDQIIDSTAGCARLSFLNAYFGYNQIKLKKEDEEKIAFITPYGVFCYQVMPFGL
jgi:hypothetical protein